MPTGCLATTGHGEQIRAACAPSVALQRGIERDGATCLGVCFRLAAGSIAAASTSLLRLYRWLAASSIRVAHMSHAGAKGRSSTPSASLRVSGLRWAYRNGSSCPV